MPPRIRRIVTTAAAETTRPAMRPAFALLCAVLDRVLCWAETTRQRRALARLDDRLLRDIGLTRTDVEAELRRPPWRR